MGENVNSILAHHIFNSRNRPYVWHSGREWVILHFDPFSPTHGLILELNMWWARIELTFSPTKQPILRHQSLYFDARSTATVWNCRREGTSLQVSVTTARDLVIVKENENEARATDADTKSEEACVRACVRACV